MLKVLYSDPNHVFYYSNRPRKSLENALFIKVFSFELTEKMNLQKDSYPAHIVLKDTYLMVVKLLGGWLDLVLGGLVDESDTQEPAIVSMLGAWLYSHKFSIQSTSLMFSCCVDTVGLLVDRTRVVAGFNHTPTYQARGRGVRQWRLSCIQQECSIGVEQLY